MIRQPSHSNFRTALRVREAYVQRHEIVSRPAPPCLTSMMAGTLEQIARHERLITKARDRHFDSAWQRLLPRYTRLLDSLQQLTSSVRGSLNAPSSTIPSLRLLLDELEGAELEFGAVEFQSNAHSVSVITEPITLEGVALGEFRIVLYLADLPHGDLAEIYGVEAVDACPASSADDVSHPHVLNRRLCAGDALAAIRHSLRHGRLCEFFVIVRSVLNTYNRESAYVELEQWDGMACSDCGCTVNRDDMSFCESCQEDCCDECSCICPTCRLNHCKNCLLRSHETQHWVCPECAVQCERCEEPFIEDELDEGLCSRCTESEHAQLATQSNLTTTKENQHDPDHINRSVRVQTQEPITQAMAFEARRSSSELATAP